MTRTRSAPLPVELARMPLRTIRPQDIADVYAHPRPELARLADGGVLRRVARGYYVVVPAEHVGRTWLPELEATAAGIASAIFGTNNAVLMGMSAARALGAMPRAMATAVVAVPAQHRRIELADRTAVIQFVKRDIDALDAEQIDTALGKALTTTPEQTVLDLARRPRLGDAEDDVPAVVATLFHTSDRRRLNLLAAEQHVPAALRRAEEWAGQKQ